MRSAYPASTRIQAFMAPVLLLFSILKIRDRNCCFAHVVLVQYATVQLQSVTEKIPELAQIPTKQICKLTGNIKFACKWKEVSWKKIIDINKNFLIHNLNLFYLLRVIFFSSTEFF